MFVEVVAWAAACGGEVAGPPQRIVPPHASNVSFGEPEVDWHADLDIALPVIGAVFGACCCAILWLGCACTTKALTNPQWSEANLRRGDGQLAHTANGQEGESGAGGVAVPAYDPTDPADRTVDYHILEEGDAHHGVWCPAAWSRPSTGQQPRDVEAAADAGIPPAKRLQYPPEGRWEPDMARDNCRACRMVFTLTCRRHHCRGCGLLYCGSCAPLRSSLRYNDTKERICKKCNRIALGHEPSEVANLHPQFSHMSLAGILPPDIKPVPRDGAMSRMQSLTFKAPT
eukprot:TRINITY_DN3974_c0_g1_i1.p1 TRINITY_DN3974_c0_g1~~TRINITY_DN3974_c0_g1_i1.p1  ORF type:complete len:286 (+),score=82.39 TRINITY_DN3974_c0_g1_i1:55-912(+)